MYLRKKKEKFKKNCIIICLIVFLFIGFFTFFITNRKLTIFEKAIKDSVLSIENLISYPIDYIIKNNINETNINLKYKTEIDELKKQIDELKSINNISSTLNEYIQINATVSTRNINDWQDIITINKGENDGIEVGMPVVINNNLVGKVVSTSFFNSTVRLITATDIVDKISVKINDNGNYLYGILNKYDDKHIVEGLSSINTVSNDSIVTTTGMGNIYPAGIIIGKVIGAKTDNFDLANVLEVKSLLDFNNINYVTVLKRKA